MSISTAFFRYFTVKFLLMNITTSQDQKLQFSGHESFACKQFWLKKGYDFISSQNTFNDQKAVVDLGVGKNMVASIRYWLKVFNIIDEVNENPTAFGNKIFSEGGFDPYLEDIGSLWLLHYQLIRKGKASIYSLLFNEFRKERRDFTKDHLHAFLKRKCNEEDQATRYNENTINTDINVLFRNYIRPERERKNEIEDAVTNMFSDLELITQFKKRSFDEKLTDFYQVESDSRNDLPCEIVFFSILDNFEGLQSISFRQLLAGENSPGAVFALNNDGLYKKIIQITDKFEGVVYNETAGNQVLQIKTNFDKWEVLNGYYNA